MCEAVQISEHKRKLLEQYLQLRIDHAPAALVGRRDAEAAVPLTSSQQQLWLHAQLAPHTAVYNEPFTVHRRGPLDVTILQRSFTEIIRRHEAWRTNFPTVDGQPVQVVNPPFEVSLAVEDLRNLPVAERKEEALRLATQDACRPFDLAHGPLFRARVIRLGEEEFRLAITAHHIIFDGVTGYCVFLPELVTIYNALCKGRSAVLPELEFQHADYAVWQHERVESGQFKPGMDYWRGQLGGVLPVLQLPTDRPRPATQSFRGALQSFTLTPFLSEALRSLSRQEGVTLFMVLLAAFDTLLHRYSGQEDILVGSITAGRNYPGTEKLLGFFLNTVVLRTDLTGDPTFHELLKRTRNVVLGALSHDEVPFDQVVKELHPGRDLSSNPLFQVLLSLEPSLPAVEPGWDLTAIDVETGTAKFDLCLVLDDRVEGLQGRVIYSTDLFDSETITRMIGHWQTLLESVVADPSCRISALPIIPEQEKLQLSTQRTGPSRSYPAELVHGRFEAQVRETPNAIAVACAGHTQTYAELNSRSNQLAWHLRTKGVGPEIPVALCLERSVEMIVGILGILKAGGTYVPLDASHPAERLAYMLADCKAPVLLTQGHLPPLVKNQDEVSVICLDSDWRIVDQQPTHSLPVAARPEDLAYVIYTSGSTGKPKGVLVTHRNLSQSNNAREDYYKDRVGRYLLLSSVGFDSSVAVIFHALCTGGMLVLPEPEFNWQLKQLASIISENQITHTLCVPSLYAELLEVAETGQLESLQTVVVAGEACPRQLVDSHYRAVPGASLFNEYGPTEATVWSTVYRCEPAEPRSLVPIGRPIANTATYVLDRNLQLVPIGIPGELYIGGAGVARGYLNQADLTAEKFILDPKCADSVGRLYKTGDVVRQLSDGNLEFLDRLDQQVKIRGARIELAEIEAALSEHPDVKEVAVAAQDGDDNSLRLAAYVVPRRGYSTSAAELRAFLKSRLPSYMVPSGFMFIPALPRTAHGKLDRQALSACENTNELSPSRPTAPRDFTEARLLAIWKDVLANESLDITQDFFELGGHSLLAARLLARVEADFGQTLSLAFVFQAPTIELMAELLRQPDASLRARAIIPVQPNGSRLPLFWVRGGPRFRQLAQKLGPDQAFLGLDLPFADASKFRTPYRLEDIATYMVKAMRDVQPHGPYSVAGLCVNAVIAYEIAQQLTADGEEVALVAMFDGHNHAYYTHPLADGRYSGRVKYHLANLFRSDLKKGSTYLLDRLDEARRKIERTVWELSAANGKNGNGNQPHNTDFIVHPAFHRYEPHPYPGKIMLFQSSDWPEGSYFDFRVGWTDLAQGGVDFHRVPGDHPSMFTEPNVDLVAGELRARLNLDHPQSPVEISAGTNAGG